MCSDSVNTQLLVLEDLWFQWHKCWNNNCRHRFNFLIVVFLSRPICFYAVSLSTKHNLSVCFPFPFIEKNVFVLVKAFSSIIWIHIYYRICPEYYLSAAVWCVHSFAVFCLFCCMILSIVLWREKLQSLCYGGNNARLVYIHISS